MERTKDTMTAGIVNVPLTKPATIYFICRNANELNNATKVFSNMNIPFETKPTNKVILVLSKDKVQSASIKDIFRLYRSFHPRVKTDWRYLFWETDSYDQNLLNYIIALYRKLELPLYYHKSGRGYHFMSVKPISKDLFKRVIPLLRQYWTIMSTNEKYPPVTLRIKANKYIGELELFKEGNTVSDVIHRDTLVLKDMIERQAIDALGRYYYIVYYPFDSKKERITA